jgi:tetratricopeptide (TPR) repeat protein
MGKLRDKLNRVNAPRPTALPDGSGSASAEPRAEEPPSRAVRQELGSDERELRSDVSNRSFTMPSSVIDSDDSEESPATEDIPRFRAALESSPSSSRAQSSATTKPTRRDALDLHRRGSDAPPSVFRSRDFEKWRKRRKEPHLEARRESAPSGVPEPEPLLLERTEGPPITGDGYLRAAYIEESRNRLEEAVSLLERALEGPLSADTRWTVVRRLAELYVDRGSDEEALPLLRELCEGRHGDPYPLVVLAALIAESEPDTAAELRGRAKEIAPWLD